MRARRRESVPALAADRRHPGSVPGTTLGIDDMVLVVSAGAAIASTPFFLLATYIVRIGTIAKRTLAIGPFILRESQRSEEIDLENSPMRQDTQTSRRRTLALIGTGIAGALAGCNDQNSQGSQSSGDYDFEAAGDADNLSNNNSSAPDEASAAEAQADQPSDYAIDLDELELRDHDIVEQDNYKGVVIEGLVENTGSERVKTAEVRARVYDGDDNLLGRYLASTNDLDPGMTWRFEAIVLETPADVESYDLAVVGSLG